MNEFLITVSLKESSKLVDLAKHMSIICNAKYVARKKRSITAVFSQEKCSSLLVIGKRMEYYESADAIPFCFHLSMGLIRAKRVLNRMQDPLLTVCQIKEGDRVLDATLGLGSDALVLSVACQNSGTVIACESKPIIANLVKYGLENLDTIPPIQEAGQRIQIEQIDHLNYLQKCASKSFEIVYFDPMFREGIEASMGVSSLKQIADHRELLLETIIEAKRVAVKRVVLKERKGSKEFSRLGFCVGNTNSQVQYGVIVLEE